MTVSEIAADYGIFIPRRTAHKWRVAARVVSTLRGQPFHGTVTPLITDGVHTHVLKLDGSTLRVHATNLIKVDRSELEHLKPAQTKPTPRPRRSALSDRDRQLIADLLNVNIDALNNALAHNNGQTAAKTR